MHEKHIFISIPEDEFIERLAKEVCKRIAINNSTNSERVSNWLTHLEAAKFLKKTPASLYKLTCERKIKYSKRGKQNYFKINDLEKYLSEGEVITEKEMIAGIQLSPKRKNIPH